MKKTIFITIVLLLFSFIISSFIEKKETEVDSKEERGIFISYIELSNYLKSKDKESGTKAIEEMVSNVSQLGFNLIILQVRAFSDAIYSSSMYPWSSVVTDYEGNALDYDILDTFLKFSHKTGIKLFAWVNPYRIRGDEDISDLSSINPAFSYLNTDTIYVSDGVYYNPAKERTKELIASGIDEIVKKYDVDGILFDDYFYPTVDEKIDLTDFTEYQKKNPSVTLTDFRLMQVTDLIKRVYKVCHKNDVLFAVSPDGNMENNYQKHYADVKLWGNTKGYVDYLMPQIYYGFYNEIKPFISTLEEWENISTETLLMPVLAFYKVGLEDSFAKSGKYEWIENNDIIMREILLSRNSKKYSGFSLFRYDYLFNTNLQTKTTMLEIKNMKKVVK